MIGCNNFIDIESNFETANNRILSNIMDYPDSLRKHIRLLAKQYHIHQIKIDSDISCNGHTIRESPMIIEYSNFGCDEVFELKILNDKVIFE
jgi:hypothetical protein